MTIGTECNSPVSAPFVFKTNNLIELGDNQHINMYPNPVSSYLRLTWQVAGNPKMNIEISDAQGRPVVLTPGMTSGETVYVGALKQGIYYVRIYNETSGINTVTKIIKQ
jgi:hypothetical protein